MRRALRRMALAGFSFVVACGGKVEPETAGFPGTGSLTVDSGSTAGRPDATTPPVDARVVSHDASVPVDDVTSPILEAGTDASDSCSPASRGTILALAVVPFSLDVNPLCGPVQLHAFAMYEDCGQADVTRDAAWSSSEVSVATVNATGVVTVVQGTNETPPLGDTTVTATFEGLSAQATVEVDPPGITMLVISPATATLPVGATQQFTATGMFTDGTSCDVSTTASWSIGAPSVGTIDTTGLATAVGPGSTPVTAIDDVQQNTATLTVTP